MILINADKSTKAQKTISTTIKRFLLELKNGSDKNWLKKGKFKIDFGSAIT